MNASAAASSLPTCFIKFNYYSSAVPPLQPPSSFSLKATSSSSPLPPPLSSKPPLFSTLQTLASASVLAAAAASFAASFSLLPAKAQTPPNLTDQVHVGNDAFGQIADPSSSLSDFLDSNVDANQSLKSLLQQKLDNGEDEEALKILTRLVSAQPSVTEWKFLMARLLAEMGEAENARKVFEEILRINPLSFEALFENALLMDRCGEGEAVISRLQEALEIAKSENKVKEARDVKLIMAQIMFLQKNVEEALESYKELSKEDPNDFRPYFCRGMIYSLLDRNEEAKEQFAKYRNLSPKRFEVDGYLRTPLSRMKMFGSNEN